jgi:uncharacterized protein YqeY
MAPDHDEALRDRLRRALPAAMRARDAPAVAALRSALAAIDNAEAIDTTDSVGSSEALDKIEPLNDVGPAEDAEPGTVAGSRAEPGVGAPVEPGAGARVEPGVGGPVELGAGARAEPGVGDPVEPESGGPAFAGSVLGVGAAEAERRRLTATQTAEIVRAEIAERESAADAYDRAGQAERAERLRHEASVLRTHLEGRGS